MQVQSFIRESEARQPRLLARLRELVKVESPSHDKAAVDRAMERTALLAALLASENA